MEASDHYIEHLMQLKRPVVTYINPVMFQENLAFIYLCKFFFCSLMCV